MNEVYPLVPLGEFLTQYKEYIEIPESKIYPKLSVKLYGKGVVLDEPADGTFLKMKKHQIAKSGQVILSEIWGKKGAIGFVPPQGDGALCTSHFFLFDVNYKKLEPKYLQLIFSANFLEEQLNIEAKGTTGYAAVRPKYLLAAKIPLPPLEEQRRIVARIEELVGKIEEVRSLRQKALEETEALIGAEEIEIWTDESLQNAPTLQDVTTYLSRGRQSKQGESKHYLIKTQHVQMGKYVKPQITLSPEIAAKVSPEAIAKHDDILIACSAAGCLGRVACYIDSGIVASTDTHIAIARPNKELILPEYLYSYLKSFQGQVQLRSREKGDWTREKSWFPIN